MNKHELGKRVRDGVIVALGLSALGGAVTLAADVAADTGAGRLEKRIDESALSSRKSVSKNGTAIARRDNNNRIHLEAAPAEGSETGPATGLTVPTTTSEVPTPTPPPVPTTTEPGYNSAIPGVPSYPSHSQALETTPTSSEPSTLPQG